jgi:multicomponent Na+:H+ antiporter subunit E
MGNQLLIKLLLAFIWLFLQQEYSIDTFIIGFILGLFIVYPMRHFFGGRFYMVRACAGFKLLVIFIRELILSNYYVVKLVLSPKLNIKPGIFTLHTELTRDWEVTLLANLISLTPGTLTLKISEDRHTMFIHALDIQDMEESVASIKNSFEKAIMEVSR